MDIHQLKQRIDASSKKLVLISSSLETQNHSSKSNRIPDEKTIEKLEKRNHELSKLIHRGGFKSKDTEELYLSIDQGYVRKFWVGCLG